MSRFAGLMTSALLLAGIAFVILFVVLGVTLWVSFLVAGVLLVLAGGASVGTLLRAPSAVGSAAAGTAAGADGRQRHGHAPIGAN